MKTRMCRTLICFLWAAAFLAAQQAQETEVRSLMADFLKAFHNLDWPAFRKCWVDNPVVFLNIEPKDIRVDFPAPTIAVVTFHLGPTNGALGRRMFVIAKTSGGWKITHLHASNLSLTPN
jgi:ketosteroid isomerase-like protein